jgi:uncharacterized phage protein (TIGR01671 family)
MEELVGGYSRNLKEEGKTQWETANRKRISIIRAYKSMREIKFRAYHKEKNRIYDVEAIDFANGAVTLHLPGEEWLDCPMDEVELMQYTGICDRKGKEIYEGDRVRYHEYSGGKNRWFTDTVIFEEGQFKASESFIGEYLSGYIGLTECEVVGNIYEPEKNENPSDEIIDSLIMEWHESDTTLPAHEYIGMTKGEYDKWLRKQC